MKVPKANAQIVCKFGGTSCANADQIKKICEIVSSDAGRCYVVVSAPGKRPGVKDDEKITDLLIEWHNKREDPGTVEKNYCTVLQRFTDIVRELGVDFNIERELSQIRRLHAETESLDYLASRGEYLNAKIVAKALNRPFVDATNLIVFNDEGTYSEAETMAQIRTMLTDCPRAVIPGYYGAMDSGKIVTFSRGGSDITGAIIAAGVGSAAYENWKDVDGLLCASPRIVKNPRTIEKLTFSELRELTYAGAHDVFHDEAVHPVRLAGIPINVRNTDNPSHPGTWIVPDDQADAPKPGSISGIAGRMSFVIIDMKKDRMNDEVGFLNKVTSIFARYGISIEHVPTAIDNLSIIVDRKNFTSAGLEAAIQDLRLECRPDSITTDEQLALICTVGRGMSHVPGTAAKLLTALAARNINVHLINQGPSEINIIVGVDDQDFDSAIQAIYNAFVH